MEDGDRLGDRSRLRSLTPFRHELGHRVGLNNGADHYKLALDLERLANDGLAELQRPGSTVRRFRRRAAAS